MKSFADYIKEILNSQITHKFDHLLSYMLIAKMLYLIAEQLKRIADNLKVK